jgi:hypothetical protein
MIYRRVQDDVQIQVNGADLSARDNAALAVAITSGMAALTQMRDRCIIDDAELLRMAYKFAGEVPDVEAILERGRKAGKRLTSDPDGLMSGKKPDKSEEKKPEGNGGGGRAPIAIDKVIDKDTGEPKDPNIDM